MTYKKIVDNINPITIPSNGTFIEPLNNFLYEIYGSSNNALIINHIPIGANRLTEYIITAAYSNSPHPLSSLNNKQDATQITAAPTIISIGLIVSQ
jgi:hypothetical protein